MKEEKTAQDDKDVVTRIRAGLKRTREMFTVTSNDVPGSYISAPLPPALLDPSSYNVKVLSKVVCDYKDADKSGEKDGLSISKLENKREKRSKEIEDKKDSVVTTKEEEEITAIIEKPRKNKAKEQNINKPQSRAMQIRAQKQRLHEGKPIKPEWHAPWKLMRVIQGHLGWVQSIAVDPANQFFVTGSADRTIKVWDLASGNRLLTLTGHVNDIRGLAISDRHPYMFSASEDKSVKCWDLETNRIIRHYHGHLSGVYSLSLHPTIDVLVSGGRDSCARVSDIENAYK